MPPTKNSFSTKLILPNKLTSGDMRTAFWKRENSMGEPLIRKFESRNNKLNKDDFTFDVLRTESRASETVNETITRLSEKSKGK